METLRVLREKFQWDGYMLHDARQRLLSISNHVTPTEKLSVIQEDPDDDRILECAVAAKSDFIVSEDKDLLRVGQYGNAPILNIPGFHQYGAGAGARQVGQECAPKFIEPMLFSARRNCPTAWTGCMNLI
jgi:hypothetical protein